MKLTHHVLTQIEGVMTNSALKAELIQKLDDLVSRIIVC